MKKDVLGVKVDDVAISEIVSIVQEWLKKDGPASRGKKYYIVTPNPEIVMMANSDLELKKIINNADLAIPDGRGLKLATDIVCNSPGVEVLEELVGLAANQGFAVGFLGGRDQVAKKTAECLRKKYPKLKVSFADSGGEVGRRGEALGVLPARSPIRSPRLASLAAGTQRGAPLALTPRDIPPTDLLFVAFGPPKQEKWIANNLAKLDVKVVMGVGGSFDYLSGVLPRAPKWIRKLGFEWLFRLIIQPWRIKRQFALIKYLWLLTKHR